MKERPAGITLLVILYFVLGGLSLLWSFLIFGFGGLNSLFGSLFGAEAMAVFGNQTAWSGFLGLITAAVQIVVAFGLLGMYRWAYVLAMIGVVISVLQGLVGMFSGGIFGFMCGSLGLILPVIILIYLLRPKIRQAFGY